MSKSPRRTVMELTSNWAPLSVVASDGIFASRDWKSSSVLGNAFTPSLPFPNSWIEHRSRVIVPISVTSRFSLAVACRTSSIEWQVLNICSSWCSFGLGRGKNDSALDSLNELRDTASCCKRPDWWFASARLASREAVILGNR